MPRSLARLAGVAFFLAACDAPLPGPLAAGDTATPLRGGTLELAMLGDVRTLDPARMTSGVDAAVGVNLYAGLLDVDRDGHVVPVLAERIELHDDGRTIRVSLRPGVRFHDGAPLDAHAVVASIRRVIDPATESTTTSIFSKLRGFDAFRAGATSELPGLVEEGPLSLRFELSEYDATFLPSLTLVQARPICPSSLDVHADE